MSGAAWNDLIDGILVEHKQDGTHSDVTADSVTTTDLTVSGNLTISGVASDGWTSTGGTHSVATGYNAGNRSFTIDTSTDLSSIVSEGMRYRVTRNTTPPTQCADLEASSSHYASKSSPTGLPTGTTISAEAWIKLESYTGDIQIIVNRYLATGGWLFRVDASGKVQLLAGNSSAFDIIESYQSVPLGKWVHVAASLTINTSGNVYIDGVSVPTSFTNSAATAIADSGDLKISARYDNTLFFDGKLADVRVWSDIRTATEIQDNMYAYPSDTTGLVAHFKLNGGFTDASSNGNDLTAQNSAVATNADNPWNATEYGIITAVSASDIQVFCPEGYGIPNETLTAPFYSTQSAPYGFPRVSSVISEVLLRNSFTSTTIAGVDVNGATTTVTIPEGYKVKITAVGQILKSGSAGDVFNINLQEDGSNIQVESWNIPGSNYTRNVTIMTDERAPTAGSHTYKVRLTATGAGTMQFNGSSNTQAFLRVELVGLC